MYKIDDIRTIVNGLRTLFPELSINEILENFESAVEKFGVQVKYAFMEGESQNVSGYLMAENNKPVIVLNAEENTRRQRFTLAHELGHLILHWQWLPGEQISLEDGIFEVSFRKNDIHSYTPEENLREEDANTFAGEFLIPVDEVKKFSEEIVDKTKLAKELSIRFNVSYPCASVRVANLQREGVI